MNRRELLKVIGLGGLSAVPGAKQLIEPEPKVIEKTVIQDKLLEWNGEGSVYWHPTLHKYVQITDADEV